MLKEWTELYEEVTKCLVKSAEQEIGIKIGDEITKNQSIELTRLQFRCYYTRLRKIGDKRFEKLMSELAKSVEKHGEVLAERQFGYQSRFQDPRDVLKQNRHLDKIGKVILQEIDKAISTEDTRLVSRMFYLSFLGNITNQTYLGFIEPLIDMIILANQYLGLDADWATSLVAVVIGEALVKKKLRELGFEPNRKDSFHTQAQKLKELLKEEGKRPPMDVLLTEGFRNIRHEVVHDPEKWKPEEEEANEISRHTIDLAKALWPDLLVGEDE